MGVGRISFAPLRIPAAPRAEGEGTAIEVGERCALSTAWDRTEDRYLTATGAARRFG